MRMTELKSILMRRDGISSKDADALIKEAQTDLMERLEGNGDDPHEICADHFGLEPDYIMDLI